MLLWIFVGLIIIGIAIAEPNSIPYRLSGAINGAIFGGIGGGLGALLEFLVRRRWGTTALTLGVFIGFIISQSVEQGSQFIGDRFYQSSVKPRVDRALLEKQLVENPDLSLFKTLQKYDPERFNKFLDEAVRRARNGESTEETISNLRKEFIEPIFVEKVAYLPDKELLRYIHLIINEMDMYSSQKPELCIFALRGQSLGDVRPYLSKPLIAEELRLLEETIKVKKGSLGPVYTASEQDKLLEPIILNLTRKHGDAVQLLDASTASTGREFLVCKVGADYFREIAALPPESAAKFMRTIFASKN